MLTDNPLISLAGMLIVIVLVIGLAYWFTRYVIGGKHMGGLGLMQKNEQLRVLAQTQVGKDQRLAVVQAGERYFLLGMTPQNISLVAELSREEADVWISEQKTPAPGQETPFRQAIQDVFNREKKR